MTGEEYIDALRALGLSINDGARFLRISNKLSVRVARGDDTLQWVRAALLRIMIKHRITPQEVEQIMGGQAAEENDG